MNIEGIMLFIIFMFVIGMANQTAKVRQNYTIEIPKSSKIKKQSKKQTKNLNVKITRP